MKIPVWLSVWLDRITRGSGVAAEFWADYYLLIIGSLLVTGSVLLKWVQFPFSRNLSGLTLSLVREPGLLPHVSLFAVGTLGLFILLAALLFWRRNLTLLALCAAILLMLWTITPAQIAFRQPSVLRRLTNELQLAPVLNVFAKDYLLQNYGMPELVPKRLVLYSAWGRFVAAISFLRLGWYCFGIGAILIGCYALGRMGRGRVTTALLLLCLPVGAFLVLLIPPAIGQHFFTEGMLAKARGRNQEAIADFRAAMRWDRWHAQDIDLYATIGQLQRLAGIASDSPERHIIRAVEFRENNEYEPALFEFSLAKDAGGWIAETARREEAATRVTFGLALYHAGGVGAAVTNWELAMAEDPTQIYALPYLVRGYYDLGRYERGIAAGDQLAKLIKQHNYVLANVYSMVGDCYAKLGKDADARRYYSLSLAVDPTLNYWALTGLVGE